MANAEYVAYMVAAVLFILGLKQLGSARTARRGNLTSMMGMLVAILTTLIDRQIVSFQLIVVGVIVGTLIGAVVARRVQMTAMPQMVALFNGFGGAASAVVAYAEFVKVLRAGSLDLNLTITIALSVLIGTVTFTGSLIAYAKLQGIMGGAPTLFKGQQFLNALLLAGAIVLAVAIVVCPAKEYHQYFLLGIVGAAAVLGVLSVIPIGGADMPVVISLLNAYSGLAAAATGFVLNNSVLIVSGALVGASGLILTKIMCVAMNRSLANVFFAGVGAADSTGAVARPSGETRTVVRYTPDDVAIRLDSCRSVIIVPGYGLAVAQAQHAVHEMATILGERGVKVRYAIHPVAGRMPGHMNVLLAEANVPYDMLFEMDDINEDFQETDMAIVLGANDVVNPAARYKKESPLYGMPILNADQAQIIVICKRSLAAGFAGEANELFFDPKTMMVFGDAKKTMTELVNVLKA